MDNHIQKLSKNIKDICISESVILSASHIEKKKTRNTSDMKMTKVDKEIKLRKLYRHESAYSVGKKIPDEICFLILIGISLSENQTDEDRYVWMVDLIKSIDLEEKKLIKTKLITKNHVYLPTINTFHKGSKKGHSYVKEILLNSFCKDNDKEKLKYKKEVFLQFIKSHDINNLVTNWREKYFEIRNKINDNNSYEYRNFSLRDNEANEVLSYN